MKEYMNAELVGAKITEDGDVFIRNYVTGETDKYKEKNESLEKILEIRRRASFKLG